jgi:hypothetical protein
LGAAVAQQQAAVHLKFVALGVSTEIVVIVENENFRLSTGPLAKAVRSGKATDTATNNDQVVAFAGIGGFTERIGARAVSHAVSYGKTAIVIAAHAGFCRRVVIGGDFRRIAVENGSRQEVFRAEGTGQKAGTCTDSDAVQKIAPGNLARHA